MFGARGEEEEEEEALYRPIFAYEGGCVMTRLIYDN